MTVLTEKLTTMLEPVVESLGYELVWIELAGSGRNTVLRVYIDAAGGIDLGDCERVSREVEGVLDVEDPISQAYRLEISSPGLDRPLVKPEHFERFAGQEARVTLAFPRDGRKRFSGVIYGMSEDGRAVLLETPSGVLELDLADIEQARLVPKF